jgi:hypothetical protein
MDTFKFSVPKETGGDCPNCGATPMGDQEYPRDCVCQNADDPAYRGKSAERRTNDAQTPRIQKDP